MLQSLWRTKGHGRDARLRSRRGAEESQGHKALGIHRPCLGSVRAQRGDLLSVNLGQQDFEIHRPCRFAIQAFTCDLVERARQTCFCMFCKRRGFGQSQGQSQGPWPSPTKQLTRTSHVRQISHENHGSARPFDEHST